MQSTLTIILYMLLIKTTTKKTKLSKDFESLEDWFKHKLTVLNPKKSEYTCLGTKRHQMSFNIMASFLKALKKRSD